MVSDVPIQGLRRRVLGESEHVPATEAGQMASSGDEEEPKRAHAPEEVRVGALARPRFRLRQGIQLEAADQVVGEDAELLPGTVGRVVLRRDHVERELALELGEGLLLRPAPAAKAHSAASPRGRFVATAEYS